MRHLATHSSFQGSFPRPSKGDVFPWWPVIVIAIREFGVSLYRSIAARRGVIVPAQRLGKYKAFPQYCSVGFVLLPLTADADTFHNIVLGIAVILFWGAFVAPRAGRRLPDPLRLVCELVIFAGATAAYLAVGQTTVGIVFAVAAAATALLVRRWPEPVPGT